jgi:hypothetical protein
MAPPRCSGRSRSKSRPRASRSRRSSSPRPAPNCAERERLPGLLPDGPARHDPAGGHSLHESAGGRRRRDRRADARRRPGHRPSALHRSRDEKTVPRRRRDSVLQAPAAPRAARLRPHRSGQHRGIHPPRRLRGRAEGVHRDDVGDGVSGNPPVRPARSRRRRLSRPAANGRPRARRKARRNTSSATPTRATRARS